ncbi:MAG: hypothetical protein ACRDD8_05185 [Bacteroidales bacterium]
MILATREGYKIVMFKKEGEIEKIEYSNSIKWLFVIDGAKSSTVTFKFIEEGQSTIFSGEYNEIIWREVPNMLFFKPGRWIIECEGKEYFLDIVCESFSPFQLRKEATIRAGAIRESGFDEQIMTTVNRLSREVENIKAQIRDAKWRNS